MHTVFLVAGRSGSGKDTLCRMVADRMGLKILKSYTDREKRFEGEDTHEFIGVDEQVQGEIISETVINGHRYFATMEQLKDCDFYIIDKVGIDRLKAVKGVRFVVIYIWVPEEIRRERVLKNRGDDEGVFDSRCQDEDWQFRQMEDGQEYDYMIKNINIAYSLEKFMEIVKEEKNYESKNRRRRK